MKEVDEWTIKSLFQEYHAELTKLETEHRKNHIDFSTFYDKEEELGEKYAQMTRLAFSIDRLAFSYLTTAENFVRQVKTGYFNSYDGVGYYLDWDGNELGYINWSDPDKWPENTVFFAWYNK